MGGLKNIFAEQNNLVQGIIYLRVLVYLQFKMSVSKAFNFKASSLSFLEVFHLS